MVEAGERYVIFERAFMSSRLEGARAVSYPSLIGSSAAFALAALARNPESGDAPFVLAVTDGLPDADRLMDDLSLIERETGVRSLMFPPALEDDAPTAAARIRAASALGAYGIRPYPLVMVAPFAALIGGMPDARRAEAVSMKLRPGGDSPLFADVLSCLAKGGYTRTSEVSALGEYSVRGGIVDFWPPAPGGPTRAEFFGDDLESLRSFNPATQTSTGRLDEADISPVDLGGGEEKGSIVSALPERCIAVWLEYLKCPEHLPEIAAASRVVYTGEPAPAGVPVAKFQTSPLPGFAELGIESARHPEILEAQRLRLKAHLAAARKKGVLVIEDEELSGGFEIDGLAIATKSDRIFAHRRVSRAMPSKVASLSRMSGVDDIQPGELVVHASHGIGRFLGSTEIASGDTRVEVFELEYDGGRKLHVPVAHAHLLSRYVGVKGAEAKLHKLDGRRWTRERQGAEKSVMDLAARLLDVQARRAAIPGFSYDIDPPGLEMFEKAFPYEETADQTAAIAAVKADLAAPKPMDRLICGDAGYGKTEVAMRAAFIAAMNGKQVAVLAPTTVLAEQHYETFLARFDGTPIQIEAMSRFQGSETHQGTRMRLASGATDIVIGTHAILSARVRFHDLGLVIIDEEQRFGVKHKEHLKSVRTTADVLTMSATPIPRTLYMSMTGARDLSQLRTPPRERVAVETVISRDLDRTVKEAVERELGRGGQVYYLYNRVSTIESAAARIRELVPCAKIEVAHGQMPSSLLAAKMSRFAKGETNVLVCTTIIESGLDIPRANTILVDRSDRFGLAELYQIRGRVGRSSRQGYAFFLTPSEGMVDSDARERLAALKRHSGLGAGFNIALRDLELRGAGNLLGREQSGHIAAIGFQLYCQLLKRTIALFKGERVHEVVEVSLNLDFLDFSPGTADQEKGAVLPYDYVEDESPRAELHRRLAEASTMEDVLRLRREMRDRFGPLPRAAARLVKLAEFRVSCARRRVARIDVKGTRAAFYVRGSESPAFVGRLREGGPEQKLATLARMLRAIRPDGG